MSELLLGLVVASAVAGSTINTIKGWLSGDEESYSFKKFIAATIPAVFGGIVIGQNVFSSLATDVSLLGAALLALATGYGLDQLVSKGKKDV